MQVESEKECLVYIDDRGGKAEVSCLTASRCRDVGYSLAPSRRFNTIASHNNKLTSIPLTILHLIRIVSCIVLALRCKYSLPPVTRCRSIGKPAGLHKNDFTPTELHNTPCASRDTTQLIFQRLFQSHVSLFDRPHSAALHLSSRRRPSRPPKSSRRRRLGDAPSSW